MIGSGGLFGLRMLLLVHLRLVSVVVVRVSVLRLALLVRLLEQILLLGTRLAISVFLLAL